MHPYMSAFFSVFFSCQRVSASWCACFRPGVCLEAAKQLSPWRHRSLAGRRTLPNSGDVKNDCWWMPLSFCFLFKSVKVMSLFCSFVFDLIDLHFHLCYVYDCIPHWQLKTPIMRHEPWVFLWQTPAKQMILASLGVAMRTRPFGCSQVIVFALSSYSFKACKSFFLKSNAVFDQRLGGFACSFSNQRVVFVQISGSLKRCAAKPRL